MTNSNITNLTAGAALSGTEEFPAWQTSTKKITAAQLKTYTNTGVSSAITTQEEGVTLSSSVTTLNFVGAGVTASGAGATTTVTIPGGGSTTFDVVGSGTNTTAAMVVGTGGSLTTSGSGTIVATTITSRTIGGVAYDGSANITVASATGGFAISGGNLTVAGTETITSADAAALTVGRQGATNPVLKINAATGTVVTGIEVIGAAAGGGVAVNAISSGTDEGLTLSTKGFADLTLKGGIGFNIQVNSSTKINATNAIVTVSPGARTSIATASLLFTAATGTTLTASTEAPLVDYNMAFTQGHSTGALTLQRDYRIRAATHTAVGASTITDAATLAIDSAPIASTNATLTNSSTIYSAGANVASGTTNSFGLNITANSGAGTNWAAQFVGNTINTGTLGPSASQQHTIPAVASDTYTLNSATQTLAGKSVSGTLTLLENASIALDPAGSADGKWSGISVTAISGYTQAFGDLVTLDKDDSRWEAVDISVAAAATGDARGIMGMVVSTGTDGNACTILLHGIIRADANFPALTIGAAVYASTTGDIVVAQPSTVDYVIRIVGSALTADEIYFNPDNAWITHT